MRKKISSRVRFEVFKRDSYTCRYCKAHGHDVQLTLDHIIPVAAGGTDEIENLVTSCVPCNSGKSDRLLEEGSVPIPTSASVAGMREKLERQKAHAEVLAEQRGLREHNYELFMDEWIRVFHGKRTMTGWECENAKIPYTSVVHEFIESLGIDEVLRAVRITGDHEHLSFSSCPKYFVGVCRGMQRDAGIPLVTDLAKQVEEAKRERDAATGSIEKLRKAHADWKAYAQELEATRDETTAILERMHKSDETYTSPLDELDSHAAALYDLLKAVCSTVYGETLHPRTREWTTTKAPLDGGFDTIDRKDLFKAMLEHACSIRGTHNDVHDVLFEAENRLDPEYQPYDAEPEVTGGEAAP